MPEVGESGTLLLLSCKCGIVIQMINICLQSPNIIQVEIEKGVHRKPSNAHGM